jgi:hypothetical protein
MACRGTALHFTVECRVDTAKNLDNSDRGHNGKLCWTDRCVRWFDVLTPVNMPMLVLSPEDGGSMFLLIVGVNPQVHIALLSYQEYQHQQWCLDNVWKGGIMEAMKLQRRYLLHTWGYMHTYIHTHVFFLFHFVWKCIVCHKNVILYVEEYFKW